MNGKALLWACVGYIAAAAVVFAVLNALAKPDSTYAFIAGAVTAMGFAAFHIDRSRMSTARDTAVLGLTLALLTLITGLATQQLWHWMKYPDVELTISTIGSFMGAFVLFPTMRKAAVGQSNMK